jgi:Helix-turn-helix domain
MADERTSPSIPVSTNDRLLNLAEAATRLRMGQSTLRAKLSKGLGPVAIKLPGSDHWRFRPQDLEDYVKAGELSPEKMSSAPPGGTEVTSVNDSPHALRLTTAREIEPV